MIQQASAKRAAGLTDRPNSRESRKVWIVAEIVLTWVVKSSVQWAAPAESAGKAKMLGGVEQRRSPRACARRLESSAGMCRARAETAWPAGAERSARGAGGRAVGSALTGTGAADMRGG